MKVIFLDFDGVLVNLESLRHYGSISTPGGSGHPDCVAALNRIIQETGARIVVSSTWRMEGVRACRRHLKAWGVKGTVIGCTPEPHYDRPETSVMRTRGYEIGFWLREHLVLDEDMVILDDDADMGPYMARLVQTQFEPGLTMADAEKAIKLLKGGTKMNCSRCSKRLPEHERHHWVVGERGLESKPCDVEQPWYTCLICGKNFCIACWVSWQCCEAERRLQ